MGSLVILLVLLNVAIRLPAVQNFIVQKVVQTLRDQTGADIQLDRVVLSFPKTVVVEGLLIKDLEKDTLLYLGKLKVNAAMWGLLRKKIHIKQVEISNTTVHLVRPPGDSTFNFSFISDSLSSSNPDTAAQPKNSDPWEISLGQLTLEDIHVSFLDSLSGFDLRAGLGTLDIELNEVNLDTLSFNVDEISLAQTQVTMSMYGQEKTSGSSGSSELPHIDIGHVRLDHVGFRMDDKNNRTGLSAQTGHLKIDFNEFNLNGQKIHLDELVYENSDIAFDYFSPPTRDTVTPENQPGPGFDLPWDFRINELNITNLGASVNNTAVPDSAVGFDPGHLMVKSFILEGENIAMAGPEVQARINHLSFSESHGLQLKQMKGFLSMNNEVIKIEDFVLETPGTEIRQTTYLHFEDLSTITAHPETLKADINLEISKIDPDELRYFIGNLTDSLPIKPDSIQPLYLSTKLSGNTKDLQVSDLSLNLLDSTKLRFSGSVRNITSKDSLNIKNSNLTFQTTASDIRHIGLDTFIPKSIGIPSRIQFHTDLAGNPSGLIADAGLQTSFGDLKLNGIVNGLNGQRPDYKIKLKTAGFKTGSLLKDTAQFGNLAFDIQIEGKGFEPQTMETAADINIHSFTLNQYNYQDIQLVAGIDTGLYTLNGRIDDEYLNLVLDAKYRPDTIQPKIDFNADLKGINLQALGFSDADIRAKGKLIAHLTGNNSDNLNGNISTREVLIIKEGELYPVDSLIFISVNDSARTELSLHSDFLDMDYKGSLKISQVSKALLSHINQYFSITPDTLYTPTDNQIQFDVHIKSSALLTQVLVPGLDKLDPGRIDGTFDESVNELEIKAALPLIGYNGSRIKDLNIDIASDNQQLTAGLGIGQVEMSGYLVMGLDFNSTISDNQINGSLQIQKQEDIASYDIPFRLEKSDTVYLLSFPDNSIVLNSKTWQFATDDAIRLSDLASGNYNFKLSSNDELVTLSGHDHRFRAGLQNFRMSNLGNLVKSASGDTLLRGTANGELMLYKKAHFDSIGADFTINQVEVLENPLGNLTLKLQHQHPDYMQGEITVSQYNDLVFKLNRIPLDTSNRLDIELKVGQFKLNTITGFLPGSSDSIYGWIAGDLSISNSLQAPRVNGKLSFHEVHTELESYGTFFTLDGEQFAIEENDLVFNNFTIRDKKNGSLTLDGNINTGNFGNFSIDMKVDAQHFRAIDKPANDKGPYQGILVFSTNTNITGPTDNLQMDAKLTVNNETDFALNNIQTTPTESSYKGVVEFVDKDRSLNPILIDSAAQTVTFSQQNINLTAQINIDPKASLAMVVDPRAGDRLWVKGSANLTFSLDETGIPSLSGRYNLNDGGYKLTLFDITQREFHLKDGSYILWTGAPMEARLQIDATYEVSTSPYNLIIDQTSNVANSEVKQYRQKLPFTVILMIRGEINTPIIDFDIELPPDKQAVYNGVVQSKLNELKAPGNESSLNKQVLSLLAFKQFMPQNPLEMGGESSGLSAAARSSVSRLLSNQLNAFSEKYIKGVSVNFDVNSYEQYTDEGGVEQRTELGIGLSKSFFDDRLEVSVGSNVELESDKYRKQNSFNDIAEDIEVQYKLTPDGVYRAKAFRYDQYEQFEGDIIQSGISFIFTKDFNDLRQLFTGSDEKKKKKNKNQDGKGEN